MKTWETLITLRNLLSAGEMAAWVKHLPWQREDLSLNPLALKNLAVMVCTPSNYNCSAGEDETKRSLGLSVKPSPISGR